MLNIDKLNWNLPEEQQRRQIETLRLEDDGEIETLILPPGKKDCWQNCAIVLSGLDDATLTRFLPGVLQWFRDLNWPGVDTIEKRLKQMPEETVKTAVSAAVARADREGDEDWAENLQTVLGR